MEGILSVIKTNHEIFTLAAVSMSGVALLLWLLNTWQVNKVMKKYKKLMAGNEGKNLEDMLNVHLDTVNTILDKTLEVEKVYQAVRKMAENSIQNVGLVRFNAFSDTGSDLSFALALLDYQGNGLVINSLFGRNETRTYAKPVHQGISSYHLSVEEEEAIRMALESKKE